MAVTKHIFGKTPEGQEIEIYSITNKNGVCAEVMTYGATLVNLLVLGKDGVKADINLGYDSMGPYTVNMDNFGATIGPNCNRIGGASFMLEGKKIQLPVNDGANNLHTDLEAGISKKVWKAECTEHSVRMTVTSKDGELGLPGNRTFWATYTLTDENELELHYEAESDKNTLINMTNHAYFNLKGHDQGTIHDHILWIRANQYTELVKGGIPNGRIVSVKGTPFDFTTEKEIGQDVDCEHPQIRLVGGYDHNFVLDDYDGSTKLALRMSCPKSGRTMEIYTNLPGVQVYTGNFIGKQTAKEGAAYDRRMGVALETQFFPDAPNHPEFPSDIFGPDRRYDYKTIYKLYW